MNRFAKIAGLGATSLAVLYKSSTFAFTSRDASSHLKLERRPASDLSQLKLFSVTDNKELANEIAFYLNTKIGKLQVLRNKDTQEPKVNVFEDVTSKVIYLICSFNPSEESPSQSIQDLISAVSAVKTQLPSKVNVVLPYYGNSIQGDDQEIMSEEYLSKVLEDAGVDKIFTVNMHENQKASGFQIPTVELDANRLCASYFKDSRLKDLVLVYENEAMKEKVEKLKSKFEKEGRKVEVGYVKNGGETLSYTGESLEGRDVLVVDNIVDSGKPVYDLSKYLKTLGAKNINMFAIHGVLTDETIAFIDYSPIKELVITNTLPMDMNRLSSKVNQVSVAKMLADTIAQSTFHMNLQELIREFQH